MWIITMVGHKTDVEETEVFAVRGNSRRAVSENVRAKAQWFDSAVGKVQPDGTLILRPSKASKASKGVWEARCRKVDDTPTTYPTPPLYDHTTLELVHELIERIMHSNGLDFVPHETRDELVSLLSVEASNA